TSDDYTIPGSAHVKLYIWKTETGCSVGCSVDPCSISLFLPLVGSSPSNGGGKPKGRSLAFAGGTNGNCRQLETIHRLLHLFRHIAIQEILFVPVIAGLSGSSAFTNVPVIVYLSKNIN